ncbi:putative Eukaryotic translation initiation factor 5A-4 [Cocos nucifera]|uniref:Putative Eukaryotic translation initiation factor 5A-4 n=1 Tax=Cocos nucifera TaxID=13894 RepID=A0A8K0IVS6_COCNU|nr:putative Eukaryotic translation initiation factor 5A-4 [Cocos nucifera]
MPPEISRPRIMSDEEHHFESKADAGASKTFPQQAGTIRKNGYIVIKGRPCKVVEVSTSKTGKHGHAKCHFVGIDIFTAKKLEDIVPSSHNCDVPHVTRTDYQLIDISEDGFVSLLTENGNTKDDLRLPTDENLLAQGYFGIPHQQALAHVTGQAVESHSYMHDQAQYPSVSAAMSTSLTQPASSLINALSLQQMPPLSLDTNSTTVKSADSSHSDHKSQHTSLNTDKLADDGYNWRKYGQKQVKGGEYPRSYYKCTYPNCPVKKIVERSLDGQVTHIIYKGQHNHPLPPRDRHGKECVSGCDEFHGTFHFPASSQTGTANFSRDRDCSHGTPEQLSDASEGEVGDGEPGTDERGDSTQDPKRRVMESTSHRMVTEPRIIVQTTSEVDLLNDGYRWRKYGQKVVKGNPHPRSYYRCANVGCNVRKHIERSSADPKAVITTYEGKHNHDVPAARNSSHATTNADASTGGMHPKAQNTTSNSQPFLRRTEFRNNVHRPIALHPLKREHNIG